MKKFKKIMFTFVILLVACVGVFAGCSPRISISPNSNDAVTSNGGLSVQKGDCLYFVNGYVDSSSSDNKYGQADQSAIYVAKLNNGKLSYDDNGKLLNYEVLVPKVAGFTGTGLYIYKDKLFYATPNTEKDSVSGKVDEKLLDFYSISLNGENNTRIYKSEVSTDNNEFAFYQYGEKVYLVIYDTEKITVVDAETKEKTVISSDVTSFVKPEIKDYNSQNVGKNNYAFYYTRKATDEENITGNKVCYFDLESKKENVISGTDSSNTYALKQLSLSNVDGGKNYVMYTYTQNSTELYFVSEIDNNTINFDTEKKVVATKQSNTVYLYTDSTGMNQRLGIITTNSNGYLSLITMGNDYKEVVKTYSKLGKITILKVEASKVFYYNDSNQLFVTDLANAGSELSARQLTNSESTYDFSMNVNFDINGDYVYLFKSYSSNEDSDGNKETGLYLVRINYNADSEQEELVGKLLDKHIYVENDDEE